MIVGNMENGLDYGFVEHCLNYVLIIDPISVADIAFIMSSSQAIVNWLNALDQSDFS